MQVKIPVGICVVCLVDRTSFGIYKHGRYSSNYRGTTYYTTRTSVFSAIRVLFISAAIAILGNSSDTKLFDTDHFTSDERAMDAALSALLGALRDQDGHPCTKLIFGAMDAVLAAYPYHHVPFFRVAGKHRRLRHKSIKPDPRHASTCGLLKAEHLLLDLSIVSCIFFLVNNSNTTDAAEGFGKGVIQVGSIRSDNSDLAEVQ